jgi:hypothetical protein
MNQPRSILTAAALTSLGLIVAGLSTSPFNGSARAVEFAGDDLAAQRIAVAFEAAYEVQADPSLTAAMAGSRKGDLLVPPACSGQKWPEIAPDCLIAADGTAIRPVRTVTIGYQVGDATSVLVRMPAPQIASR